MLILTAINPLHCFKILVGLVKIRVGIYVAQLTKNELLNFSLFSQRLFLPESLRLEFNNGFKICQTIS